VQVKQVQGDRSKRSLKNGDKRCTNTPVPTFEIEDPTVSIDQAVNQPKDMFTKCGEGWWCVLCEQLFFLFFSAARQVASYGVLVPVQLKTVRKRT